MSGAVLERLSPELALVDPELAEAQRLITERKAAMSATEPSNGTFFVDPAQSAPQAAPLTPTEPAPLSTPPVEPAPQAAAPAPAPAPQPDPGPKPMVDVPLGTLIFRAGLLAEEQLEDALQEGMRTGKRLGEVLLERGLLHERDLGRMLAGQKGLPFVEIRAADADPAALAVLPVEKAKLQMALPLRYEDGRLVVAVADPSNELVLENLRRTLGSEPVLVVAAHGDLMRAIDEAYAAAAASPAPEPQLPEPEPEPEPVPSVQPDAVQPLTPPAVTPLPTVLPPPEERPVESAAPPPLQPDPAAQAVEAPPPAPEAPPPPPVEPEPAPLLTPPVVEPEAPAAVEQHAPPQPPVAPLQPPVEPAPQVEPVSAPVAEPPAAPAPPVEQPAAPAQPEPPPVPAPMPAAPAPEPASLHAVLVRLRDGETLEVGTFGTQAEAAAHAQEVVRMIAAAEGEAAWPFFADRYLRPETIVSVDLVAEHAGRWMGSAVRSRWASQA